MRKIVIAAIVISVSLGTARLAPAQPVLERLEQRIRDGIQPDGPDEPAAAAAGRQRGYLGVVADDASDRGRGVRILEVRPDGPADKAGLRPQDLITAVAQTRVRQMTDMADVLELFSAGQDVTFDVIRGTKPLKVKVTLGRRPAPVPRPAEGGPALVPAPGLDVTDTRPPAVVAPVGPPPVGPVLQGPGPTMPAGEEASRIEQLQRRIEQLERRVAELEQKLAESPEK